MNDKKVLADFALEGGEGSIRIEVPKPIKPNLAGDAMEEVAITPSQIMKANATFDQALSKVQPVVEKVAKRLKDGLTAPADEVEVKFGLNLSVESGVIISSVGGGVNFEVTLKWQNNK